MVGKAQPNPTQPNPPLEVASDRTELDSFYPDVLSYACTLELVAFLHFGFGFLVVGRQVVVRVVVFLVFLVFFFKVFF